MKRRIALICASNQNRSMEAHSLFLKREVPKVSSFGTNGRVKLPGPAPDKPIVFDFGVTYEQIYEDLKSQDEQLCVFSSSLSLLAPQKFVSCLLLSHAVVISRYYFHTI